MSTQKETVDFILDTLQTTPPRFSVRAMFGEYALYADGKTVALVCDDQLYVKIRTESAALEDICEKDQPYPGARLHYVVEEHMLATLENLPSILFDIAAHLPERKPKPKKKTH